jgi:hypothetical protein
MARKSKNNGAQVGQVSFDGDVVNAVQDGSADGDKAERGRGNSISYAERSAEWLREQPKEEQERIALVLAKFRAFGVVRDSVWERIEKYQEQTGCGQAEILAMPECQAMMNREYSQWWEEWKGVPFF